MDDKLLAVITKHLDRAANAVCVMTLLLTIGTFGLGALFLEFKTAILISFCFFGFCGSLEVFHRQRKTDLDYRNQAIDITSIFEHMLHRYKKTWHIKIYEEFNYRGFLFHTVGFEEVPEGPVTIAGPLCPTCKGYLHTEIRARFPGRYKMAFHCICGFSQKSDKTEPEIIKEVAQLKGVPH